MKRIYPFLFLLMSILGFLPELSAQQDREADARQWLSSTEASQPQVELGQNYPNPSASMTHIPLELSRAVHVKVEVYNLIGAKVRTLVDRELSAGKHTLNFDTSQLKNGIYLYRLSYGDQHVNRRMTVSR